MSATIHVALPCPSDADDLAAFVAAQGMTGVVTTAADHADVAVGYPDTRLHDDFERALASWLEHHERPLVPLEVAHDDYVLRPPGE